MSRTLPLGIALLAGLFAPPVRASEPWSSDACMACHPTETRHWEGSRHASSATNAHFVASLAEARFASWCRSCHEPGGAPVTCTSCHVDHEAPADDVCAGCHELTGPPAFGPFALVGDPLQSTFTEWRDTPAARAGHSCADCHLAGHRFRGAHDADLVREAFRVEVSAGSLVLRTTEALGHRLPTGDPFRTLEVRMCADRACLQELSVLRMGVRHEADADGALRVAFDNRLGPPGGSAPDRLEIPRPPGALGWSVQLGLADPLLELPPEERVVFLDSGGFP
ncbi:MAG: hypothetical protein R3F61_05590 [Myxococcota bacterium]